ncbi:MAG: hypothetical protein NZ570_07865 [Candidatus Caldarchaeum sp.]|nr:hypothetical protein [Candidatus Caldarchaeum sp.]MDW7977292.1 hypothetical protein [Candidatus Caldarchaeum sp.]MDW8359856.1 hypothetical protein [Candidatus Caldarchaeum sp.]
MLGNTFVVVWEGVDASGKTTLMKATSSKLATKGSSVETYKTPSDTATGEFAKTYGNRSSTDPLTRMLLFLANTSDDSSVIRKIAHERKPDFIFVDRYYQCSVVYGFALIGRRYGKSFSEDKFLSFYDSVEDLGSEVFVKPDMTVVVEVDEPTRKRRVLQKHASSDHDFEGDEELQNLVRRYYAVLAKRFSGSFVRILNEENMVGKLSEDLADMLARLKRGEARGQSLHSY